MKVHMHKKFAVVIAALLSITLISIIVGASSHNERRVIIVYKTDVDDDDIDDLERINPEIKEEITHRYELIRAVATTIDDDDIDEIELDDDVEGIYEDLRVSTALSSTVPQINADQVHVAGVTGSGAIVCVVDTGVDDTHPNLNPLVAEHDFVNNDTDATDDNGHGTHVGGIVASQHATFKGVAHGASLMAMKVLDAAGSGFSSDVIAGIERCVLEGADVINMSLGGGSFTGDCDSEPLAQASNTAVDQGVAVFAASGNNGFINAMLAPACASKVIAVGAVDDVDARTSFSNEGTELDIVAPGVTVNSTYLGGGFASLTGTSMATPHGSGTAALLLQTNPLLTPAQIRTIIENTAFDLGSPGFDTIYGHGRIDAFAAYRSAIGAPPPPTVPPGNQTFTDSVSWEVEGETRNFSFNPRACPETNCYLEKIEVRAEAVSERAGTADVSIKNPSGTSYFIMQESLPEEDEIPATFRCEDTCTLTTADGFTASSYTVTLSGLPETEIVVERIRYTWRWPAEPACTVDADCNDGLFCSGVESCQAGVCQSGTAIDCSSLDDQCNAGVCNETLDACAQQPANEGSSCNDGLFCNVAETCQSGVCSGGATKDCSDGNACTADSCNETIDRCTSLPVIDGTACDDGQFCTVSEVCALGICGNGLARDCSDGVACTADSCDETNNACLNSPDDSVCNDGLFCNGTETCNVLLDCQSGTAIICDDTDACTTDSCNETIEACEFTAIPECAPTVPPGEGFVLSKDPNFTTDDFDYLIGETMYVMFFSDDLDFNNIVDNEWQMEDGSGTFINNFDGSYTTQVVLTTNVVPISGGETIEVEFEGVIEDESENVLEETARVNVTN